MNATAIELLGKKLRFKSQSDAKEYCLSICNNKLPLILFDKFKTNIRKLFSVDQSVLGRSN